jgi:hypothetical protein
MEVAGSEIRRSSIQSNVLPFASPLLALALIALLVPAGCAGQKPPAGRAAVPPPPPALVSVTGIIVNGVTSRPLVGAIIDIDGHMKVESGPDGRFRIDEVPVGPHLLATRAVRFRSRVQPVEIIVPDTDPEAGRRNDFIVLLFAPSEYFATFPALGNTPPCRSERDCPPSQICLMNNFREVDAPACTVPRRCSTEADCKLGQQCEPVTVASGDQMRVCHGQPAPEVDP